MPEQHPNIERTYWKRLKESDTSALAYFYDAYVDRLFAVALRMTHNREMAKDAIQEIFIEIWTYRDTITDVNNSYIYLSRVLKHILLKKLRKEVPLRPWLPDEDTEDAEQSVEETIISVDASNEQNNKLNRALATLTGRQKLIMELRFYEGLSYQQIAEKLSMNYQSVNNLAFRTIMALRKNMYSIGFIGCTLYIYVAEG
ncbi:RNA polymerase sigma factor [Danxiaibacter flavus]|uniref:RNA polymerase sigma factor n=1 Tax=Danxiaibacter flavus TaxID=3049108 RepID=A0ABV3ZCH0_9BACT|nr:RNA polymerase sigma factor [Chitinophagaceae bacterium DXS]